jgi:hypothetical protein
MWLVLATVAEIPPAVSPRFCLSQTLFVHHHVTSQVFIILNLNGIVIFQYVLKVLD